MLRPLLLPRQTRYNQIMLEPSAAEMSPEVGAWVLGFLLGFALCWFIFEHSIDEQPFDDDD